MIVIITIAELVKNADEAELQVIASLPNTVLLIQESTIVQAVKLQYDVPKDMWFTRLYGAASKQPFKDLDAATFHIIEIFDNIRYN